MNRTNHRNQCDCILSLSSGIQQRLRSYGIFGSESRSIVSLASDTVTRSKSARASGGLLRAVPSKSPMFQISCPESLSLHIAEAFSFGGSGRNAFGFAFAGAIFRKWPL